MSTLKCPLTLLLFSTNITLSSVFYNMHMYYFFSATLTITIIALSWEGFMLITMSTLKHSLTLLLCPQI